MEPGKDMVKTLSTMLELGTEAPDFSLPDAHGKVHRFSEMNGPHGTLVMFICNHCPYVVHIIKELSSLCRGLQGKGIGVVAINSNDVEAYPADAPDKMLEFARENGLQFPYLLDGTQETARAYKAACTPDFYLFDQNNKLVYRGQLDESRPGSKEPVSGQDLTAAAEALLAGCPPISEQKPSMGCNIKWKPGSAPAWFG